MPDEQRLSTRDGYNDGMVLMIEPECVRVLDVYLEAFPIQQFILDFIFCTEKFAYWFAKL
jgi:hypothetical protein